MPPLSNEEKRFLLRLAQSSLESAVRGEVPLAPLEVPPRLQERGGAFVSLHKKSLLRGCVGYVQAAKPLYQTVMEVAVAAALNDPRFEPVRPEELPDLEVEISVLSPSCPARPEEIEVGVHGLMISSGHARGLLLPQVAVEHQWSRERFLEETCRKAGLPRDAWQREAKIEVFTAEVFQERSLPAEEGTGSLPFTPALLRPPEKLPPGQK